MKLAMHMMPRRSKLVPAGIVLVEATWILAFLISAGEETSHHQFATTALLIALLVGGWTSVCMVVIGLLRNRRWKARLGLIQSRKADAVS